MRDVFYTILVVWIIWRIMSSVNTMRSKSGSGSAGPIPKQEPPKNNFSSARKSFNDQEGEYVDYEEVK